MKIIAKALLFDRYGKVLVLRRSKTHPLFAHHYDFPGGEVGDRELETDAVAREIAEETGMRLSGQNLEKVYLRKAAPTVQHVIYQATLPEKEPDASLSWEHDKFKWMSLEALMDTPVQPDMDDYYETVLLYLGTRGMS